MSLFDMSKITQQVINSFVKNQVKSKGAPSLSSNTTKTKPGTKAKTSDGIDMGFQVDQGVIPVVYGHIGLSNTQFDLGRERSKIDSSKAIQTVRFPVSEGPIAGIAHRSNSGARDQTNYQAVRRVLGDSEYHFQEILLDDSFIKPTDSTYNFKDVKYSLTQGDGVTKDIWQSGTIGDVTTETEEALEEIKKLNDLGDVEANPGVDYVLYWNQERNRWEAKSFSDLLQNAFDNRNSTGDSSDDTTGQNLKGDAAKNASNGIKYTQWNPPPHEICWPDDVEPVEDTTQTVEYTKPPKPDTGIVDGLGAALQDLDCPTPYFITEIDFTDVEYPCQQGITLHFAMPDGLYREITTTEHIKNARGKFKMRDTTRPIENAGNLLCLDPENIDISDDGYTYTTRVRENATVEIGYMFTTEICGREFVLDEGTRTIGNNTLLGRKYETEYFAFASMNAGRGYDDEPEEKAGGQQIGSIKDPGDCNADDVLYYDFDDYELLQYLQTYPKQIITKGNTIRAYVWINEKTVNEEYNYSTAVYLSGIEVCDEFTVFDCDYYKAQYNIDRYILNPPDHRYLWQNWKHDWWERVGKTLKDGRLYNTISGGTYSATPGPGPLMIMDYCPAEGTTVGDVVFPPGEALPYACMKRDGIYPGDETGGQIDLPAWDVNFADENETLTVVLEVSEGALFLEQGAGIGPTGNGTNRVETSGILGNMILALNSVEFIYTPDMRNEVNITTTISAPTGNYVCEQKIRVGNDDPLPTKQPVAPSKAPFMPADSFTNGLDEEKVSWFQLTYRPKQKDDDIELSEIGLYVAGRIIQEPTYLTFDGWKNAGYTSTLGYSANPAWVLFDYLTNDCFGLYNEIVAPLTDIQKDKLYNDIYCASQWCNYQPLAQGSNEPRVARFNGLFYAAESKYEALQKIADSFHGKFVYINGNPRLIWDGQGHIDLGGECGNFGIKKLVNQASSANTTYTSGSIDNLYNVIKVKYNDPFNYYKLNEVEFTNVRSEHSIANIGRREVTVELYGCTRDQQALWYGAWLYETEASNGDMISYTAGWDHHDVEPGDLIHVCDTILPGSTTIGGRASNTSDPNVLQLDRDYSGSIAIMNCDNEIVEGTASNGLATVPSGDYVDGCVWNGYSVELKPTHKVIAIEESEDGVFGVTAQKHDPDKYTRIWNNTV